MCFTFSSRTKRRSCSDESKLSRSETLTAATSQQWLIFCISHSVTTSRHTVEVRRRLNFSTQNQKRHRVIFETITSPEGFPPPLSFLTNAFFRNWPACDITARLCKQGGFTVTVRVYANAHICDFFFDDKLVFFHLFYFPFLLLCFFKPEKVNRTNILKLSYISYFDSFHFAT